MIYRIDDPFEWATDIPKRKGLGSKKLEPGRRIVRFIMNLNIRSKEECWEYLGCCSHSKYGHGCLRGFDGNVIGAARFAYELWVGPVPEGLEICHLCDNPPCCNPYHLEENTHAANMKGASERKRIITQHGEDHKLAKITEDDVREIRRLRKENPKKYFYYVLAEMYGVDTARILEIVKRKAWAHVA